MKNYKIYRRNTNDSYVDRRSSAHNGIYWCHCGICSDLFLYINMQSVSAKRHGREFAHNGKLSAGKPRGAGIIFITVFTLAALLFGSLSTELIIYLVLIYVEMLTGYMDDAADEPWGEYKKGILDFIVAAIVALNYIHFNSTQIQIATLGIDITLHPVVFFILTIILVWAAINVTNCSDGVDGLSGTLTIVTLVTIYVIDQVKVSALISLMLFYCLLSVFSDISGITQRRAVL